MSDDLSHFDGDGAARMVDVGDKAVTQRLAVAEATVRMQPETLSRIRDGSHAKGDVLAVARLAGILAAKQTAHLIPLCHAIPIEAVTLRFDFATETTLVCQATARTSAKTGVEMEALTAATVATLTVYDMCKSIDRGMQIETVRLLEKSGGKSGPFHAE